MSAATGGSSAEPQATLDTSELATQALVWPVQRAAVHLALFFPPAWIMLHAQTLPASSKEEKHDAVFHPDKNQLLYSFSHQ